MAEKPFNEEMIFQIAREIGPTQVRADYLRQACGDDRALLDRVETLLLVYDEERSFLESPPAGVVAAATLDQPLAERPGTTIGPYKLLQQIGEGGFGVVYMADQTEPIQRRVALKIIKPGMDSKQVIARFEAEEHALAMMDHPNIAKVYDAGVTDSDRPYFVMELVRGVPITQYCDQQHLTPRERLDLFIPVCRAVQHAHQKGIIHRDIKPSNVLVAPYDDQPVPKVIDFGVAKATSQKLTENTMFTQYGQIVGTPEYMSPEQASLNQLDVDTRSDIFSLGVLLYELLTGTTPFDRQRLRSAGYEEMLRIIREEEPPKPSTRLSGSDQLPAVAANRRIEPKKLSTLVFGELDWIVMKALEKDRKRRYETANGFANDIQRYLNNEAVVACPPSVTYRFRKFARRNKVALATTAMVAAALILGIVGTTWQAVRATRAERDAVRERDFARDAQQTAMKEAARADQEAANARADAAIAQAVNAFIHKDLLGSAHPAAEPNRDLKVRDVLDRASRNIAGRFADQPRVKATILYTIGHAYQGLGEYVQAQQHFEQSRDLYCQELGLRNRHTLKAMSSLAIALQNQNRYEEAEKLHREVLDIRRQLLGPEHPTTLASLGNLANMSLFHRRYAEAEKLYREVLESQRHVLGPEDPGTLGTMNNLANAVGGQGRYAEAEKLYREVLDIQRRVLGPEHPDTLGSMNNVANAIRDPSRYDEAVRLHRETLEIRRRVLGAKHPGTIDSMHNLANTMTRQGRYDEAIGVCNEATGLAPENCSLYTLRATTYLALGRYVDAVADYSRYLALKPDDVFVTLMRAQGLLLADQTEEYRRACVEILDRFSQSENAEARCHAARACVLSPAAGVDPMVPVTLAEQCVARNAREWTLYTLAMAHLRAGQLDEAAQRFQQSLDVAPTWDAQFLDWLGLALLSHARGEMETSRQQLDRAIELMMQDRSSLQHDRLEGQLLLREVKQLLESGEEVKYDVECGKAD